MLIQAGYDIRFETEQAVPMLACLRVHPSRRQDLRSPDPVMADPSVMMHDFIDGFGNACTRFTIPPGGLALSSRFEIEDSGALDLRATDGPQWPVEHLPDTALIYLMGSRYCETDRLMDVAWKTFGHLASARDRVEAVVDFVNNHITFGYEYARPDKTAWNGWQERQGVCRDFAHLAITLCRCLNIPARYCTGYLGDIGIPAQDAPMDFSAWFDVFIAGDWYTYDARHNQPRIGRILMARGRDATDTALTTAFGTAMLKEFTVHTEEMITVA